MHSSYVQLLFTESLSTDSNPMASGPYTVADLEIFREGFSFTKTPAKLEMKTKQKKKVFTSSSKFTLKHSS